MATVLALPGCHTQAKSLDELMKRIKGAIELCLEVAGSDPESLDCAGVQRDKIEMCENILRLQARPSSQP